MIDEGKFVEIVKSYFLFLCIEFGFEPPKEKIVGNAFYDLERKGRNKIISISYENISDYFQVIVFLLEDEDLPNYDDKTKTLHLNRLNAEVLSSASKIEIQVNNEYFSNFITQDDFERKVLQAAKELRLCLRHFQG